MGYACACGNTYFETLPKAGHAYTVETVAATCKTGGYDLYQCTACGYSTKKNSVVPTGKHIYAFVSDTATCTADGIRTEKCETCSRENHTESKATGHGQTHTISKEATCYSLGYTRELCNICNGIVTETEAGLKPHKNKTMALSDAAALSLQCHSGYSKYLPFKDWDGVACQVCGAVQTDTIHFRYTAYEAARLMLGYVNDLRESVHGTDAYNLKLDDGLITIATYRARDISIDFSHDGCPPFLGENIATNGSLYDMFKAWCNSPGHYKNMIDTDYTTFGFGFYMEGLGVIYGVQSFCDASISVTPVS